MQTLAEIKEICEIWKPYLPTAETLPGFIRGITPKLGGCGLVYELENPLTGRPDESFAIADMTGLDMTDAHKHGGGEWEIYYGIEGSGLMSIAGRISSVFPGQFVPTPPDTMHVTAPSGKLIVAVINTPPFSPDNVIPVPMSDPQVGALVHRLDWPA